jgi:hypothetical protein
MLIKEEIKMETTQNKYIDLAREEDLQIFSNIWVEEEIINMKKLEINTIDFKQSSLFIFLRIY